jgi:hypothetical protein
MANFSKFFILKIAEKHKKEHSAARFQEADKQEFNEKRRRHFQGISDRLFA